MGMSQFFDPTTGRMVVPLRPTVITDLPVASQAEAEAGTVTTKVMTPQRVKQAIDALAGVGIGDLPLASEAEATAGVSSVKVMTPLRTAQAIDALAGSALGVTYVEVSAGGDSMWLRLKESGTNNGFPRYVAYGVDGALSADLKVINMGGGVFQWQLFLNGVQWYWAEADPAAPNASATPDLVTAWDNGYDNYGKVFTLVAIRNGDLVSGQRSRHVFSETLNAELYQVLDTDGVIVFADVDFTVQGGPGSFNARISTGVANGREVWIHEPVTAYNPVDVLLQGAPMQVRLAGGGVLRLVGVGGSLAVASANWQPKVRYAYLLSDVVANSATANTLVNLSSGGLGFPVLAGVRYRFRFVIQYDAAATTTGSRWTLTGPALSAISYRSVWGLTTTSETVNNGLAAYSLPAAANASSPATAGNIAILEGFVMFSTSGTFAPQCSSEVASSAITAKVGSVGEIMVIGSDLWLTT
jgi:hypothetical protein